MASDDKISIYRAEAVTLNFTVRTTDDSTSPAQNITGWTLAFTIAPTLDSPTKTLTKAAAIIEAAAGKCSVALSATETNIPAKTYQYDLWRTDTGQERPLAVGVFSVLASARVPVAAP